MKLALLTMLAVVAAATGLLAIQPASAQLPGSACGAHNHGSWTYSFTYSEKWWNAWVLAEFQCVRNASSGEYSWSARDGYPLAIYGQEKPGGYRFTGNFDKSGHREVVTVGSSTLERSAENYWNTDVSQQIQRGISKFTYAGDICASLSSGDATGAQIDPSHVYRVGGNWHHIPDADDREAFGRPDARMSSIWGYRNELHDHDNDPSTPKQSRRVSSIQSCATE